MIPGGMRLGGFASRLLLASLFASAALAQAPEAGAPPQDTGLRPFDPEALATPPPEWRTPPPPPPAQPRAATPAPEPRTTPDPEPPTASALAEKAAPQQNWYGWNFYLLDPLALGSMAYGVYGNRTDLLLWGMAAYALNGPLIHLVLHGRALHAAHSLGYRLLAPLAVLLTIGLPLGAIGEKICSTSSCERNQIVGLLGFGMLLAWGWDIAYALEPGDPPPFTLSANFGTTDRGTPTAGLSLRF